MFEQQQSLGRRFSASKVHLSPLVAQAAVRSKAVVLLLLIYSFMYFPLFVGLQYVIVVFPDHTRLLFDSSTLNIQP